VLVVMCGLCTLPSQRPGWGRVILTGRVRAAAIAVKEVHAIAVRVRAMIEATLPGMRDIDVDLELDETDQRPKEGSS